MIRAVLAVMAGLLCSLAGMKHASSLKGEAARLTRWVQLLRHLVLLLQEGTLSIPEAIRTAADGSSPPDRLLRETAMKVHSNPALGLADAYMQCSDSSPERELLIRMFNRLGRGTKESRILALEQAADELQLMAENASVRAEKDAKLWQTLGFTGGACITIMLL